MHAPARVGRPKKYQTQCQLLDRTGQLSRCLLYRALYRKKYKSREERSPPHRRPVPPTKRTLHSKVVFNENVGDAAGYVSRKQKEARIRIDLCLMIGLSLCDPTSYVCDVKSEELHGQESLTFAEKALRVAGGVRPR